jgi:hypothetical protein
LTANAITDAFRRAAEAYAIAFNAGISDVFSAPPVGKKREETEQLTSGSGVGAPALLERLKAEAGSIADKELSALLARDQLIPVVHNTTYEALRDVSPMLASRNGLNTAENTMANVAAKLAELVALPA